MEEEEKGGLLKTYAEEPPWEEFMREIGRYPWWKIGCHGLGVQLMYLKGAPKEQLQRELGKLYTLLDQQTRQPRQPYVKV